MHPSDELEAFVWGELEPARAAQVAAHVAACAGCRREVEWLKAETALVRRQGDARAGTPQALWPRLAWRLALQRRRRLFVRVAAAAAAAAVVLGAGFALRPDDDETTPGAAAALDRAEAEYQTAIAVLEARLGPQARPPLPHPRRARGPEARVRELESYAAYLRALRRELDEAAP